MVATCVYTTAVFEREGGREKERERGREKERERERERKEERKRTLEQGPLRVYIILYLREKLGLFNVGMWH